MFLKWNGVEKKETHFIFRCKKKNWEKKRCLQSKWRTEFMFGRELLENWCLFFICTSNGVIDCGRVDKRECDIFFCSTICHSILLGILLSISFCAHFIWMVPQFDKTLHIPCSVLYLVFSIVYVLWRMKNSLSQSVIGVFNFRFHHYRALPSNDQIKSSSIEKLIFNKPSPCKISSIRSIPKPNKLYICSLLKTFPQLRVFQCVHSNGGKYKARWFIRRNKQNSVWFIFSFLFTQSLLNKIKYIYLLKSSL